MIERLEATLNRYENIEKELSTKEVLSDIKKTTKLSKEMSELEDIVTCYKKYKKVLENIKDCEDMIKDPELGEIAKEDLVTYKEEKEKLDKELEILLIPKDPNDGKNVVMEIRGAAGGDEANIFAGAYSKLKYESGSHRVQRVPVTESNGRLQTSTATVLVMPEVDDDVEIDINPNDLRIDIYRSSGCGGQGVNTTDSAVRITHLPTNTVVTCQNERSQIQNKEQAMKVLKARLYEQQLQKQEEEQGAERRSKIGTGDRAEKIRTYNYPQNRVTDHRIGFTTKQLDRVMDGDLNDIINALIAEDQKRKLEGNES